MGILKEHLKNYKLSFIVFVRWFITSIIIGIVVGLVSTGFAYGLSFAVKQFRTFHWLLYLLPVGGIFIVGIYRLLDNKYKSGTNLILSAIHSNESVPLRITPLIIITTIITHLFGGSAGREGAALQIGGSIGDYLSKLFHIDEYDRKVFIMCGMSAAFSALFGTPVAAAVFSLEVTTVGILHYSALFPSIFSSVIANQIARNLGIGAERFNTGIVPEFNLYHGIRIMLIILICTEIGVLFCIFLHFMEDFFKNHLKNEYIRIITSGCLVILLTLISGTRDYNGSGVNIIEACFEGNCPPYAFLLKILFTAITLSGGFKGGEIVPSFTVGAASGFLMASIFGMSPGISTACGMIAVFCAVTNCPIASLLIGLEMFGHEGLNYYMITVALSSLLSGYHSLYHTQKFAVSKIKPVLQNNITKSE